MKPVIKSKSNFGFAPLIILLIATLIVAVGYFTCKSSPTKIKIPFIASSPTPSPIANWETYISPDNAYSFGYPFTADWEMTEDPKNPFVSCNMQNCRDLKYTVDLFQVHTIKPALSFNDFKKRCSYLNNITETKFNTLDAIEGS